MKRLQNKKKKRIMLILSSCLMLMMGISFTLAICVIRFSELRGNSMSPTFENGDQVLLIRHLKKEPQRGDVVSFYLPGSTHTRLVKRVVGLPGETVSIEDGIVLIDGTPLSEPYIEPGIKTTGQIAFPNKSTWVIPEGHFFAMGDNRRYDASNDSRNFGFIPIKDIFAFVVYRF